MFVPVLQNNNDNNNLLFIVGRPATFCVPFFAEVKRSKTYAIVDSELSVRLDVSCRLIQLCKITPYVELYIQVISVIKV